MEKYKRLHLWLIIPFIIIMLGFMNSYWIRFTEVPWRQHLHGITATLWFVILIVQPYLATHGKVQQHRFYGLLSLFIAGGVVLSALATIPHNLVSSLPDVAKYGLSFIDIVLTSGFCIALFMAIKNVKCADDHARWMISTVFWIMGPGLTRFIWVSFDAVFGEDAPSRALGIPLTGGLILLALITLMIKERKAHPAYLMASLGCIPFFILPLIGNAQWWIDIADSLFTL